MRLTLHVVSRNAEPFDLNVEIDSYLIGRSSNVDLVIRDPSISRQHARIFRDGDQLFIEDLGSHNGTWVGDVKVTEPTPLHLGDEVELARDPEREACALFLKLKPFEALRMSAGGDTQETIIKDVRELFEMQTDADLLSIQEVDKLREYAERMRIINDVHTAMSSTKTLPVLLDLLLDKIFLFLTPEAATIFLEDEDKILSPIAQRFAPGSSARPVFSQTLVRQLSEGGNALLVHDALHDYRFASATSLHMENIRSMVASPLVDSEGSIGLIMLYCRDVFGHFNERDMAMLVSLASVAALRIRSLSLAGETQTRLQRMVDDQTKELNARKEELETLDAIVRSINMEHSLERVLQSVLEQGSVLFPQAEKAIFLLRSGDEDLFLLGASMGYADCLDNVSLTEEEAMARFASSTQEIEQGVYLTDGVVHSASPFAPSQPVPNSSLVMTLVLEGRVEGFVVFDNFSDEAFGHSDLRKLARFSDHAASAVAKARLLHTLEGKNEEVGKRQNQLLIREKMASLGHLTAGVSHEINNPNNFIYGGAQNLDVFLGEFQDYLFELAGEDLDKDLQKLFDDWFAKLHSQVATIKIGSQRINNIVRDLQLVSRLDESQRKHVDLLHSLSATINLMEPSFNKIQFSCDFRGPLVIHCYPAELNQVFMNLIVNAGEAMMRHAVGDQEIKGSLSVQALREDKWAVMRFQDTGPGIDEKHMPHLFEAFYTTKTPGENTGLGLYTCWKIIEKHDGHLEVKSTPGKGTTVIVKLPLDEESLE